MKSFITGKCSFLRDGANLAIAEQRWRHHIALMVNLSLASPTNMVNVNKKRVGGEFESTCKDELGQILHIFEREGVQQSWNDFIRWSAGVETINPKSFGALPKKQIDCRQDWEVFTTTCLWNAHIVPNGIVLQSQPSTRMSPRMFCL